MDVYIALHIKPNEAWHLTVFIDYLVSISVCILTNETSTLKVDNASKIRSRILFEYFVYTQRRPPESWQRSESKLLCEKKEGKP